MKVVHVSFDCKPLTQTKEIAQTIRGEILASKRKGIQTALMIPLFKELKDTLELTFIGNSYVTIGESEKYVGVLYGLIDDIETIFIDNMEYFYLDKHEGYSNDGERMAFFSYACLEAFNVVNEYPDIIHIHDYQGGLIPHVLKAKYKYQDNYLNIRTILTIHNIKKQGTFPKSMEEILDIDNSSILYCDNEVNFLKAAVVEADFVTTTSKTFEIESRTKVVNDRLRFSLRSREDEYIGILNGIDYDYYNPATDPTIYFNFDKKNFKKGKKENKKAFKKEFGFEDKDCMLVGFSSDFTKDKGMELLMESLEDLIVNTDVQFFFIGDGERKYIDFFEYLTHKYPTRFKVYIGYNKPISHKLYVSCDMILQPYLYEPYSAGQLIAMHYGTIPFVHEAGALKDVLVPYNHYTNEGNGFSFINHNKEDFLKVFDYAYGLYRFNDTIWNTLIKRCLELDLSWDTVIDKYIDLYDKALENNK